MQALKGKDLPMTIDFEVDSEGTGTAQMTIDVSSLGDKASEPAAQTLQVSYVKDVITFELGDSCNSSGCAMTGKVSQQDGVDTIDGTLTLNGEGFSAAAAWSVTRLPEA